MKQAAGAGGDVSLDTNGETITLTDASILTGAGASTGLGSDSTGGKIEIKDPLLITSDTADATNTLDTGSAVGGVVTLSSTVNGVTGGNDDHLDIISGSEPLLFQALLWLSSINNLDINNSSAVQI